MARVLALLLHGQPGSARDWQWLQAELSGRLPTLAIDRPGYDGRSAAGGFAHSGEAAIAALDAAGEQRAVIVGHSFGGAVAAWLGVHRPARVAALVLVAPAANVDCLAPIDRVLGAPVIGPLSSAAMLSGASLALGSAQARHRIARAFALPDEMLSTTARRLRSHATRRAFVIEQRALLRELPQLEAELGKISAPTMIVTGTADVVVPPRAARRLAEQIPGAELHEIAGAHHVLPAEHPARLADLIAAVAEAVWDSQGTGERPCP
jgi:pimeloyl-ACP methyl ester carboxylesterase